MGKTCTNKKCFSGGSPQLITEFYKDKSRKDGLKSWCKGCCREYNQENKEQIKVQYTKYRKIHKKERDEKRRDRYKTDTQHKLKLTLRGRLRKALKGNYKSGSAVRDLGCSVEELKVWLEKQFEPGVTWDNHSQRGWHIDHIIPLSSFDLTDRTQFLKACHWFNLRPLWWQDNLSERGR
jgi:hypothetical protein